MLYEKWQKIKRKLLKVEIVSFFSAEKGITFTESSSCKVVLICNKLDFTFDKLTYEEIYAGIDRKYWHNSILSVEDATLSYLLKFSDFSEKIKDEFSKNQINIDTVSAWQYLIFAYKDELWPTEQNHVHICEENKYAHIKRFFVDLAVCSKEVWIYSYDPVIYLGMEIKSMFHK